MVIVFRYNFVCKTYELDTPFYFVNYSVKPVGYGFSVCFDWFLTLSLPRTNIHILPAGVTEPAIRPHLKDICQGPFNVAGIHSLWLLRKDFH